MATILISYSRHDAAAGAAIARRLEQAGFRIGHLEESPHPGAGQPGRISQAVTQCDAAVLVLSSHSATLHEVAREAAEAIEKGKLLVPVLLDITPTQLLESQPGWRYAVGSATTVAVGFGSIEDAASQVADRLKAHSIYPDPNLAGSAVLKAVVAAPDKPLPKNLAEKILASRASMEGERKQVTVLFADVAGFTSMSEKLDPEDIHALISEALASITEEVHRYEGTIAQFLGDGVMALFGAPIAHEDAPQRALHAAMGMRKHLGNYARTLRQRGIEFNMRIGLNTGLVVVGRIGDDLTMEYTAMGDTVNLASRMQRTAQPGTIRVSENTHRLTEGYFKFKPLGQIRLKGRAEPVKAYELKGLGQAKTRFGVSMVRGLTPFVGRQKELGHLLDCFELAKKGQGQVMGIVGEAGVGKSRLLRQMLDMLPPDQHLYLEGECLHYGEAVAYLPILGMLRSYFEIDEGEDQSAAKNKIKEKTRQFDAKTLESILPPLHELFSLEIDDRGYMEQQPRRRREMTFEAIRSLFTRESRTRPLILAVEDLQWIDRTSEEFLGQLISGLPVAPIMLVLLYRPEYSHPWTSKSCYSQIRVDEMTPETGAEMVQAMIKDGVAAPELNQLILSRGAGNPLFIEEFTRALLEKGHIKESSGQYVLAVKPAEVAVPETVQGIIGARIDNLKGDLKRTLQVSSVIGREFSSTVLQMTMGLSAGLEESLNELQGLELIYEKNLFPEMEYTFKHALTQDVAYNSLLVRSRREIHQRVGRAIETLYPQRKEEFYETLAHHYSKAEDLDKAYQYLMLSGEKAYRNFSTSESFRYYRQALGVLGQFPDTRHNRQKIMETTLLTWGPMLALGFPEGSLELLKEGERLADELGDRRRLVQFYAFLAHCLSFKGNSAEGSRYTTKALAEAEKVGDVDSAVSAAVNVIGPFCYRGDFQEAANVSARAIRLIERTGKTTERFGSSFPLYPTLTAANGYATGMLGEFDKGESRCEIIVSLAKESKEIRTLAVAEVICGFISVVRAKDLDACLRHLQNGIRHSEESGFRPYLSLAWTCMGWANWLQGNLDAARDCGQKAAAIMAGGKVSVMLSLAHLLCGAVSLDSGDLPGARESIEEALRLSRASGERYIEGRTLAWLGRALGRADPSEAAAAEQRILQGISLLEEMRIRPWQAEGHLLAGEFYADTGQKQKAQSSLMKAQEMFQDMEMTHWLSRAHTALARIHGRNP